MVKKKGPKKMPATAEPVEVMRHARIEVPDSQYQRMKRLAKRFGLSISAYIRLALVERMESDERKAGGS